MKNKRIQTKKRKIKNPLVNYISIAVLIFSGILIYNVGLEIANTIQLNKQLKIVEEQLEIIKNESEKLTSQKDKLGDENYVQNIARGKYMLSKEGEEIYYLPSDTKKETEAPTETNEAEKE